MSDEFYRQHSLIAADLRLAEARIAQLEAALREISTDNFLYRSTQIAIKALGATAETACKHESRSPGAGYNEWCDKCGGMLPASAPKIKGEQG